MIANDGPSASGLEGSENKAHKTFQMDLSRQKHITQVRAEPILTKGSQASQAILRRVGE
jgi:hypothetical protein